MQDPYNLSTLYGCAIKEDQKQKIRELDFGSSSQQVSAQCEVNAIKDSGCFKCGSNDHFIKDCPLNRDIDKKTVILLMVIRNITMIKDQNQMMRILLRIQFRL